MKKILLTGSSGFIGSYFINKYKETYDMQSFSFLKDDINTLDCKDVDVVLHLSALVHQMDGASKEEYERVNVIQTLQLAEKAKTLGVKHFVFMSTVKVYGEEIDIPYTQESECNPQDEYGKSKLKAEQLLQELEDETFKVSIIRTPIVYGYGVKANIKSLAQLVKKVPLLPFGKINNRRSMVYIGNLCHLVDIVISKRESGIFLAADEHPVSTTQLIMLIGKNLNRQVYLIRIPLFESLLKLLRPSFHKRLYGSLEINNSQTKQQLNLKNPYSVEDGIRCMLQGES
jgi:nucleoside-diphosphate-sugar epimerase